METGKNVAYGANRIIRSARRFSLQIYIFSATVLIIMLQMTLFSLVDKSVVFPIENHPDISTSNYNSLRRHQINTSRQLRNEKESKDCSLSQLLPLQSISMQEEQENHFFLKLWGRRIGDGGHKHKQKKPCALLFFGLAKQFRSIILPSIKENILSIPENSECDIYAHTYDVTQETSLRHEEEIGVDINTKEIYDLTTNVTMDTNEDFLASHNLKYLINPLFVPTTKLGWDVGALTNMYKQWHSIERVWDFMEDHERKLGIEYERIGLFRSDVQYTTPINIFDGDAVIPKFGFLVNDRMFYGLRENSKIWAKIRFSGIKCYTPRHRSVGMHSEFYMEDFVLKNIPNVSRHDDICFYRVRGNGNVLTDDCTKPYQFPPFMIEQGLV